MPRPRRIRVPASVAAPAAAWGSPSCRSRGSSATTSAPVRVHAQPGGHGIGPSPHCAGRCDRLAGRCRAVPQAVGRRCRAWDAAWNRTSWVGCPSVNRRRAAGKSTRQARGLGTRRDAAIHRCACSGSFRLHRNCLLTSCPSGGTAGARRGGAVRTRQSVFGLADWHRDGTLAEYLAIEARNLAPLPGDVDFTVAASLPISGLTAWQGLFQHGHLQLAPILALPHALR